MVTQMGFSDLLGDVDLHSDYGRLSTETKQKIEQEVRRLVDESRKRAYTLLTLKRKELDTLAKALVEYEVLDLDEMKKVLKGETLPKLGISPKANFKIPDIQLPPSLGGSVGDGPGGEQVPTGDGDGKNDGKNDGEARI